MLGKKRKKQSDSCSEDEGPAKKKAELFSGISFRKALKEDNAVSAIKEFLGLCKSGDAQTVVLQYLEAGGGVLELLKLLQSEHKNSMAAIVPVFSALQYIIMSTVTDAQRYRTSTEEACKHLLSHHLLTIHDMLSLKKGTAKHRRIVLKLLAAMVTLTPRLAQMVLTHVKIGPYLWPSLVKHTEPVGKSVRTSFIHFLMAFLFDGNNSVIRSLLEMKGFLASIIPGLVYDSAVTVHLVLTTLQNKILMNMAVSKTNKLHIFSTPIVRSLVALYDWKGPQKWKPTFKQRAEDSKLVQEEENEERKEDKLIVVDAVHSFLQILCTSHKYGVIFHDRSVGTSGKKHNELLQTVLNSLEKPWENDQMAELVHSIVIACPDLMKCVLLNIEPFLEPRVSVLWVKTINFVKQLVHSMNPEHCLKPYLDGLSTHQITNVVQNLCTHPVLLRALSSGLLEHKHIVIRNEALGLLVVMLQSFNNFMTSIQQWHPLDSVPENAFKQSIIKQLPTSDVMLSLWKTMLSQSDVSENEYDIQPSPLVKEPSLSSHLVAIIDLFLIYNNCFPQMLDIPSSTNFLADIGQIMKQEEDLDGIARVQERILKLLISMDTFAFTPDKEMFGDAMSRLSHLVDYPSSVIPLQARNLLCTLLINTGLFEGALSEVFVWLHCYLAVPAEQRKSVVKLLVDSIVKVSGNPATYIDYILQAEEGAVENNKEALDSSQFEDIFEELLEDSDDEYNEEKKQEQESALAKATIVLSPLFPGVLETASADREQLEDVNHFLSYVAVHLLHCQPSNNVLSHLLQQWPGVVPSSVTAYINCWSSDQSLQPLKKPFGSHSLEKKINKALLQSGDLDADHRINTKKLPDSTEESLEVIDFESLKTKDPIQILLLYKMSTFHMVQMASRGEFTEKLRDKCKATLQSLLQIFSEIDKNQQDETNAALSKELLHLVGEKKLAIHCLKHTFTHPFLLQKFMPVCRKKYVIDKLVTELILDLMKLSSASKKDIEALYEFLNPFKQKLISQILGRLKKNQKNKTSWMNVEGIVSMIELFELDFLDIVKMFERMVLVPPEALIYITDDSSSMSVWGSLLVHLLDRCVSIHRPVKQKVISSLVNQLSQLTKEKNLDLSPLEDSFFKYLEQFPHHIDHITTKLVYSLVHQEENSASCIRLLVLLLSRKPVFIHDFISQVRKTKNLRQNAALLFPLLAVALKMNIPIEQVILNKIYSEHEIQIEKALLKPHKIQESFKDNISTVVYLVDKCMGIESCLKLCQDMKKEAFNTIKHETFYMELMKNVFLKVSKNQGDGEHITQLLLICFEMIINLLKQETLNQTVIAYLCQTLQTLVTSDNGRSISHSKLKADTSWKSFIKMCLKFGLQSSENIDEKLLDTVTKLCAAFFDNDTDDDHLSTIFHLTLSHSEFLNIMLGSAKKKEKLVGWLVTLAKKNPSVMSSKHIPVYLSSYNATMSTTDKLILQLMQMYEAHGISLHECRPYLWGEAAVSHYSVRSNVAMSLWRQPSANHVMGLLNKESVLETIRKFPLTRGIHDSESTNVFCDEAVYDPAFYLPLFSHLLAPEAVVQVYKFITSGGFALTLAALASNCEDTRAAAYHVIARLYFHSEVIRSAKGRMLGLQFLDAIRNGILTMRNKSENPQVPSIVSVFLARTSLILPETHHIMYIPLQSFIIAKSSLDMNAVPEFFTFMHSPDVEYKVYRQWILQVIRDGMKSNLDFQLSERCVVFKLLLGFYPSVLCDENTKNLILQVLESAVNIQTPAEILVSKNGLISWLHQTIQELQLDSTSLNSSAINIVHSLWITLSTAKDPKDIATLKKKLTSLHLPQQILLLALELLQKTIRLSVSDLKRFLQTINGVVSFESTKAVCSMLSPLIMNRILNISKEVLGSVLDCEDLISYGCKFASRTKECEMGNDGEQAVFHLRSLVVTWLRKMYNGNAQR